MRASPANIAENIQLIRYQYRFFAIYYGREKNERNFW